MKKTIFFLFVLLSVASFAQNKKHVVPCGTDAINEQLLREDPKIRERLDLIERRSVNTVRNKNGGNPILTIPVVVYVVHSGAGQPENISDLQVQSQLNALNEYFSPYDIKFCLAGTTEVPVPLKNPATDVQNTLGIIRVNAPALINHNPDLDKRDLVATAHASVSQEKYLRIWVVKNFTGNYSSIGGYASFPEMGSMLDGIVMKYNYFGDIDGCPGCDISAPYQQGKILVHEVGHYFGLYHTFHESCSGMDTSTCSIYGDRVCDTPPVSAANFICNTGANSCGELPDLDDDVSNYMDYANNACQSHFTQGQKERMFNMIVLFRRNLYSTDNIIATQTCGFEDMISATFTANKYSGCAATTQFEFTSLAQNDVAYAWDFGDGATSTIANPMHVFATSAADPYTVTLTVTKTDGTSAFYTEQFFITDCTLPQNNAYWYVGSSEGLSFASGIPEFDANFPNNRLILNKSSAVQNDISGNLLFYSNGYKVWDKFHVEKTSTLLLIDDQSHARDMVIVPKPGSSSKYYIFTNAANVQTTSKNGFRYNVVDVTGTNVQMGPIRQPITFPSNLNFNTEPTDNALMGCDGIAVVKNCNGYWIIAMLKTNGAAFLTVYSLTDAATNDLQYVSRCLVPISYFTGNSIEVSPNGNKIFLKHGNLSSATYKHYLFDFNKAEGIISNPTEVIANGVVSLQAVMGSSFSPDSKLLYVLNNASLTGGSSVMQYNLNTKNINNSMMEVGKISPGNGDLYDIEAGPDNKLYIGTTNINLMTIHKPNQVATSTSINPCYFSPNGPKKKNYSQAANVSALPNNTDAKYATVYPVAENEKISVYVSGTECNSYKFFPNVCGASFKWEFKNLTTSSVVTSILSNPVQLFAQTGDYLITLKDPSDTILATKSMTIQGVTPVTIQGSTTACITGQKTTYNSIALPDGHTAVWTITSGTGTISEGNTNPFVTVNWTTLPGTIQLTLSNSTGCSAVFTKTITSECPVYGANNTVNTISLLANGKAIMGGEFLPLTTEPQ